MTNEPPPTSTCPHCGLPLARSADRELPAPLPDDSGPTPRGAAANWVSIGRFANLAEVGYFCDVLAQHQIPTNLRQHDEFSATDGSWRSVFILQVPDELTDEAVRLSRAELEEDTIRESAETASHAAESTQNAAGLPTLARSVAVVLVVAGIAFYAGQVTTARREGGPVSGPSLEQTIEEIGVPLTTAEDPAKPRHRIRFHTHASAVLVERDADGDGRFEAWRVYRQRRPPLD
jgi:hypothetical protein